MSSSIIGAIKNTVPLSKFNRGLAGQIFSDVKKHGSKVVMKNNTAEAVIVSPEEYVAASEALNDYLLLTMAIERMEKFDINDPTTYITEEEMDRRLGITQEDLDAVGEVEFE